MISFDLCMARRYDQHCVGSILHRGMKSCHHLNVNLFDFATDTILFTPSLTENEK